MAEETGQEQVPTNIPAPAVQGEPEEQETANPTAQMEQPAEATPDEQQAESSSPPEPQAASPSPPADVEPTSEATAQPQVAQTPPPASPTEQPEQQATQKDRPSSITSQVQQEQPGSRASPTPEERPSSRNSLIQQDRPGSRNSLVQQDRPDSRNSPVQQDRPDSRNSPVQQERPGSRKTSPAQDRPSSRKGSPEVTQGPPPSTPAETGREGTPRAESVDIPVPPPEPAVPQPDEPETDYSLLPNVLNLSWSFGMNKNVPVLNLTDGTRSMIFYACAHTGVLYDLKTNTQQLLQGHGNAISCTCTSEDKRWIVTADKGEDSMVIIWDSTSGIPVRTIFDAHPEGGVEAVAMTPDAKYLATMSAGAIQTFAIWDWTVESDTPLCTAELDPAYGTQNYILFNPEDTSQIVTNSENQVIFYSWKEEKLEYYAPPLTDDDFNKPVGKYSQSIFLSNSTRALTATSIGNLVVWDTNKPLTKVVSTSPTPDKKALKLVRLQERGINVLCTTDQYIVSGDVLGHVKFFDQTMKLMSWYQDFHLGPINSLSFAFEQEFLDEDEQLQIQIGILPQERPKKEGNYPSDATIAAKQFVLRDFVIGTCNALYAHVTTDGTDVKVIHRDHDAAVHALAAHPAQARLAVGGYSGLLKIWDYEKKMVTASRWFDKGQHIRCCVFDPSGSYIAVGFTNGYVRILDATSLKDEQVEPFRYARDVITHVAFSHDSQYLATADAEYTVSLYQQQVGVEGAPYMYMGRYRAHYKPIRDLVFGMQLDSDKPRLMSLAEDRVLVEYDLEASVKDSLMVLSLDRIEQSAVPLCLATYPPLTKESFLLTANDQYKFKLYNSTTKMCRRTFLGPTYGSPILKLAILASNDAMNGLQYIAYITENQVGLHKLPLTGNPHDAMALIAHPQGVSNLATSHDGRFVFTAGGVDCTVHMWIVNTVALEAQSKLGGEDLVPFYGLMEGGREGELFKELEDYFYYAQIRSQGVDTMDTRQVSTKIPLSEVPFVMRALGFYPSEQEIEDMLNEVKYSRYVETGQYTTDIDLGDFIKLYINHRPAFGLQPEKVREAFEILGFPTEEGASMDRADLLDLLQTRGEHMTEYELAEYLTTLLGFSEEGGSSELHSFDPTVAGNVIEENLPQEITSDMFTDELLGFGMYTNSSHKLSSSQMVDSQQLSPEQEMSA